MVVVFRRNRQFFYNIDSINCKNAYQNAAVTSLIQSLRLRLNIVLLQLYTATFPDFVYFVRFSYFYCFRYLTDDSMGFLEMSVGEKLEVLEISFNGSFTDDGK